jgi:hypothetical protein
VVLAAVASLASIALAVTGGGLALRWRIRRGQTLSVLAAILCFAVLMGVIGPRARPLWNTPRLMALVDEADPDGTRALAAETYHEDSLIFASRGRLERLADGAGADWLARNPDGILIVPADRLDTLDAIELVGRVRGFNYSNGRTVDLAVTRALPGGIPSGPGTD